MNNLLSNETLIIVTFICCILNAITSILSFSCKKYTVGILNLLAAIIWGANAILRILM